MQRDERVKLLLRPALGPLQTMVGFFRALPWPKPIQRLSQRGLERLMTRIPELGEVLGGPHRAPRRSAQAAPLSLESELSRLHSRDYRVRLQVVQSLSHHATPRAVAALRAALRDRSVEVAVAAVSSLQIVAGLDARPTLEEVLKNADGYYHPLVRAAAVQALGSLLAPAERAPLLSALRDVDAEVSIAAISALVANAGDAASDALLQVIANSDGFFLPITRLFAARSLARLSRPPIAALEQLREKESDPQLRDILQRIPVQAAL